MSRTRRGSLTTQQLSNEVATLLKNNPNKSFSAKSVIRALGSMVSKGDRHRVAGLLYDLCRRGVVEQLDNEYYRYTIDNLPIFSGEVVSIIAAGGFVKVEQIDDDVIIARNNLNNALVGDKVEIATYPSSRRGRMEGIITNITERSNKRYIGTIEIGKGFAFVLPEAKDMFYDIFIPSGHLGGAKDGDKVVAEITDFPRDSRNPIGSVVKVLGSSGDHNTEMHAILEEYELPYEFSKEVLTASEAIPLEIPKNEIAKRRDFRATTTFTIDPSDAKDFDDALSIVALGNDSYEIGVHIADVTHYITPGSILEDEALKRATSVYLVDRVVPMLPERLSNGLCSLRPNEDKLCFSAVFKINSKAEILDSWFGRTVINSDRRFTYEEAQQVIEGHSDELKWEISTLHNIATILRNERFSAGALAFDRDEPKFHLDEKGKPIGVYFKEMKDSNHLIEEFMLLANRKVAEFVGVKRGRSGGKASGKTFVYRIHDKPNSEKFNELGRFAARFGYSLKTDSTGDNGIAKELSKLLTNVKGKSVENLFTILALRTMAKAVYSVDNIGHYGLSFDYYTHFTSPIRRYPDMMVHRLLQRYLDGGRSANSELYADMCKHSSEREVVAAEAERASIKYKMVEYMSDKIGEEFSGTISGITEWGIYVELSDTHIEGMVSIREMTDDIYYFDKEEYCYIGSRSGNRYQLGDKVDIRVLRIDMSRKIIDFEFADTERLSTLLIRDSSSHQGAKQKKSHRRRR